MTKGKPANRSIKQVAPSPSRMNEEVSVNIRRIQNGYIIRKSTTDSRGNYHQTEHFSATKPNIGVPPAPPKKGA